MQARDAVALVDLRLGQVVNTLPLQPGSGLTGSALVDDSVAYVANANFNTVTRLNLATGDTLSLAVGLTPTQMIFTRGRLLVLNAGVIEQNIDAAEAGDGFVDRSGDIGVAPDITRHQRRDDRMQYTAYAPPGSLARGKRLATTGQDLDKTSKTPICATCHLANLKGTDKVPPIAGRSPTYLLRQLLAYKNGDRKGESAAQMAPSVEKLELEDLVALAAYVGSLYP